MRVVGGKTGADGKLFACVVWTVPGKVNFTFLTNNFL